MVDPVITLISVIHVVDPVAILISVIHLQILNQTLEKQLKEEQSARDMLQQQLKTCGWSNYRPNFSDTPADIEPDTWEGAEGGAEREGLAATTPQDR